MRKIQYRENKTEYSYDNNGECEHIAVCNVMHNNPSFTEVFRGTMPSVITWSLPRITLRAEGSTAYRIFG